MLRFRLSGTKRSILTPGHFTAPLFCTRMQCGETWLAVLWEIVLEPIRLNSRSCISNCTVTRKHTAIWALEYRLLKYCWNWKASGLVHKSPTPRSLFDFQQQILHIYCVANRHSKFVYQKSAGSGEHVTNVKERKALQQVDLYAGNNFTDRSMRFCIDHQSLTWKSESCRGGIRFRNFAASNSDVSFSREGHASVQGVCYQLQSQTTSEQWISSGLST